LYVKGTSLAEATSSSEKIKLMVLAVIELCLSEGISQAVKILRNKKFLEFRSNFLKEFLVNLKACFIYPIIIWEI